MRYIEEMRKIVDKFEICKNINCSKEVCYAIAGCALCPAMKRRLARKRKALGKL